LYQAADPQFYEVISFKNNQQYIILRLKESKNSSLRCGRPAGRHRQGGIARCRRRAL